MKRFLWIIHRNLFTLTEIQNEKIRATLLFLATAVISYGQDNLAQSTIQAVLTGNQAQVIQLAEAFSEEQYDWRPKA